MPNENLLKAVSWTLVHSVWQGLILAVVAGLVILFTKKSSAALRYNWLSGLFLAFIVVVGFTFNYEYQTKSTTVLNEDIIIVAQVKPELAVAQEISVSSSYFQTAIDYLNNNSAAIVLIWFLVFAIKSFGIFRNLSNIYRIRNYRTQSPPEYWSNRLAELSQTLNIKKHIVLLESQVVKVPSVTGFFKPIILIPVGLLSNLPQDQIEAILLHELAHIRRKDYFINLIQSFAEILFFFNPGVLWVSSIIKEERENCCDDIAVGITKSKSKFIHALVSFQEYNMKQNELAMGFGGNKNQLLERAKRIIYDNNKSLNSIEKTFLSICIIVIASVTLACSNTKAVASNSQEKSLYSREVDETRPLTAEELVAYNQAIAEADIAEAEAKTEAQAEAEIVQAEAEREATEANLSNEELAQIKIEAEQARKEGELARIEGQKAQIEGEQARKEGEQARLEGEKARLEGEKSRKKGEKGRKEGEKARREIERARIKAEKDRRNAFEKKEEALRKRLVILDKEGFGATNSQQQKLEYLKEKLEERQRTLDAERIALESQLEIERIKNDYPSVYVKVQPSKNQAKLLNTKVVMVGEVIPPDVDDITKNIIEDLVKEKVIVDLDNLSYKLSTSKLIVNDKEINTAVHKKLKKYLKPGITAAYYNYNLSKEK